MHNARGRSRLSCQWAESTHSKEQPAKLQGHTGGRGAACSLLVENELARSPAIPSGEKQTRTTISPFAVQAGAYAHAHAMMQS
eukprot:5949638-Alexandrium_andersonii.AAC.1